MKKLGVIVSTPDTPNVDEVVFLAEDYVGQWTFVGIPYEDKLLVGTVKQIVKQNRFYSAPDTVGEFVRAGKKIEEMFSTSDWENTLVYVKLLGVLGPNFTERITYPPSPGTEVFVLPEDKLERFLGLDRGGLNLGKVMHHNLDASFNFTKLLQKHVAILAQSGAGKSYLTSVMLEELLERPKEKGRIGIILIDVHGEYKGFAKGPLQDRVKIFSERDIRVAASDMTVEELSNLMHLSEPQKIALHRAISHLKSEPTPFSIKDIVEYVLDDPELDKKESVKMALTSKLNYLDRLNLIGEFNTPNTNDLVSPGQLSIIDLSTSINQSRKQAIVTHIANNMFKARRAGKIPPFLLIIEEAHNFAKNDSKFEMVSKRIIETIAREGRKFGSSLCLISQRPVQLSTTALSQCNTHIILRITNPNDLGHIGESSEGITRETLNSITTLRVGEALVVGEAVKYPIFVKVRQKKYPDKSVERTLEDMAKEFEFERPESEDDDAILDALMV